MNKTTFLRKLRVKLYGMPNRELNERISFYSEIIDDKIEEGLTEEAAVEELGDINKLAEQTRSELEGKIKKDKKSRSVAEVLLICLGSPLWLSLAIAAVAVILSLYVSTWAVIISLAAVNISFAAVGIAGFFLSFATIFTGRVAIGFVIMSGALICLGLTYPTFLGVKALFILGARFTKWMYYKTARALRKEKI